MGSNGFDGNTRRLFSDMAPGTTSQLPLDRLLSNRWVSSGRYIIAWISLAAAASLLVVTLVIDSRYPYPYYVPSPPAAPRWMFSWRNWSLVLGVIASVLSLPKWQSLVALTILILLFVFIVISAD